MKWDRIKLAKRHLLHLSIKELDSMAKWITARKSEILVLKYVDARLLARFNQRIPMPKASRKTITFKRFKL